MRYAAFQTYFPEQAEKETRFFQILNDPELPPDTYYLEEMYCEDPDCDCRRVLFFVFSESEAKMLAAVSYGWENAQYYADLSGRAALTESNKAKGPFLDSSFPQSEYAPIILDIVESNVLKDKKYVKRLERHYGMLRRAVAEGKPGTGASPVSQKAKAGRNEPCPCGSGKKFKKCCMV
jgi:hypothetical protein